MQVACEQDEDMLFLKNTLGLVVSVLGLTICLVYRNSMVVFMEVNKINDKLFDAKLITLGDYSVMGNIHRDSYEKFIVTL